MSASSISIVLPVYKQADHIAQAGVEYLAALETLGVPFEIVLVVNGPPDGTDEACAAFAADHPEARVVRAPGSGWGRAVRCGIAESRGDLLCYTNSARTTGEDLRLLLRVGLAMPDMVVKANRKIRSGKRRRAGSLLYNLEARALFDLPVWDINGTPKVFPRAFDALLGLTRNDDLIDLEFLAVCKQRGYRVIEVPIYSSRRHGGASTTKLRSAARLYLGALGVRRQLGR
jgi:glycosyltransferase involved in cell wall biosynthesis